MVKVDPKRNYYADLELSPTASTEDIKKQFRNLARLYHPDRNPGKEVEFVPKFQAIQAAHEVLCDPDQRAKYDADRRRLGYGPRSSPQTGPKYTYTPGHASWQPYSSTRAPQPPTGGYPFPSTAYGAHHGYGASPHTPPRQQPTSNMRERTRTSAGFAKPSGANAWAESRPPPSGYRYRAPPTAPKDDADMYYEAFSAFGPKGASAAGANTRKASTAGNTAAPGRQAKKKGGFDPTGGADEGAARMAGYNTKPRSNSETRVPRSTPDRGESSDEFFSRRESDAANGPTLKKTARKPPKTRQRASEAAGGSAPSAERPNNVGKGPRFSKAGVEDDSSRLGPDLKMGSLPNERRKAMPSKKWKNNTASKSDETLHRSPEPMSFNNSGFQAGDPTSDSAERPEFKVNTDPSIASDETPTRPAPSIDTSFSEKDWTSQPFTFVGSPTKEDPPNVPTPFEPTLFGEIRPPLTKSKTTGPANGAPMAPTVEEVPEGNQPHVSQEPSIAPEQRTESPNKNARVPVKFSQEHWKETLKDGVFALPKFPIPTQSGPGVKTGSISGRRPSVPRTRSPSKDGGNKTPGLSETPVNNQPRPVIVEEDDDDGKNDGDAMDIDTPPKPTEVPQRGPRMVRVPTTRLGEQTTASPRGSVDLGTASPKAAARATTTSTPEGRRKSSLRNSPRPTTTAEAVPSPEPPTSLNLGSLKTQLSSQSSGVHSLEDMHLHLPFESRASAQHPTISKYEEFTTSTSHPKPPHAPILPTSGTISEQHYRNLLAQMSTYMGAFHKYENVVLSNFARRHEEGARFGTGMPSTEATNLLNAKGEPRGKGVFAYAEALREETKVREEWVAATADYMRAVTGWAFLKQMVLDRGFSKGGGVNE